MGAKHLGARVKRLEDPALLAGRGRYVDDVKLVGMLHACFVRSPHAHAKLGAIDTKVAMIMPGVHAVITAEDLPGPMRSERLPMLLPHPAIAAARTQHVLARDEVCYVGQAVAVVIADTRHIAEDAAAAVIVHYDVLRSVGDCRYAFDAGTPRAHSDLNSNVASTFQLAYGDIDAAFAGAAHVFDEEIWQHRGGGMAIETRGVLANCDPVGDMLTVWSGTQTPHIGRRTLADLLGRELESIRMIAPDVGGGFGPKAIFYPEEAVIPAAALKLGRPVKWIEDRREHFLCATQERDQYWDVAIAVDADGKIRGVRGKMLHDSGAYVPWGIVMPYIAASTMPGPYVVPAYRLDTTVVFTNKVPTTPVRGAGRPQAVFAMERLIDRVARELNLDRAEVRRRNFIKPEQMPYAVGLIFRDGKPLIYDSGDYPRGQETALALAAYGSFRERQKTASRDGRFTGIGLANYVEGTGLGPFEGVTVRVLPSGKVAVASGATNQGQGTRTTLSQVVAEQVGCRIEDIVMTIGDTAAISQGVGAFASRQAVTAGCSALIAGQAVRRQLIALAARTLGVKESDIDLDEGQAVASGGNRPTIGFGELARLAQGMPGVSLPAGQAAGLEHTAYYSPAQAAYCSGTHVAEVEVDLMTGAVEDSQIYRRPRRRTHHQPAHRRRPSAGRRRPRHRQRVARMDAIRRERATADDVICRLSSADGDRCADLQYHARRNHQSAQSTRRQRRRRGRHDTGSGCDRCGDRRRAQRLRRSFRRDAADARAHCHGAARSRRLREVVGRLEHHLKAGYRLSERSLKGKALVRHDRDADTG